MRRIILKEKFAYDDNFSNKIMQNLDIDKLADSVAGQLSERMMANIATSELVDRIFQKCHDELRTSITEAIIQRL